MRKNKCRKYLAFTTIILLLGLIVVSNVNASIMKVSSDKEPHSIATGSIYGGTGYIRGWGAYGLQFVLVKAEDGDTVIGKDRSNIFCQYKISRLPIDTTYTVTASSEALIEKDGKYYGFYDLTETITLTEDKPNVNVDFVLKINYDDPVKDIKVREIIKEEPTSLGSVSGGVCVETFPPPVIIQGAKLTLEGDYITKTTFSGLLGKFKFHAVPIGRQHTLTATHPKFKTVTKTFTLTADNPDIYISIHMYGKSDIMTIEKDDLVAKTISQDSSCGGTIYGNTGTSYIWSFSPVPFALVDAEIKKTISAYPMGCYRITGLPFDQEITITASKKGYYSDTLKHTFTEKNPTYYYCFDLQGDESDIKIRFARSIKDESQIKSSNAQILLNRIIERVKLFTLV